MQPDGEKSQQSTTNSAHPTQANGTTGSPYKYTPFGSVPSTEKRPSIDESWVNVEWNELARKSQTSSPEKSPEHAPISFGWGAKPSNHFETPNTIPSATTNSPFKSTEQKPAESPFKTTNSDFSKPVESPFKESKPVDSFFKETKPVETPTKPVESSLFKESKPIESSFKESKPVESPFKASESPYKSFQSPQKTETEHKPVESAFKTPSEPLVAHKAVEQKPTVSPAKQPEQPKSAQPTPLTTPAKSTATPSLPPTISAQATPTNGNAAEASVTPSKATPKARTPKQSSKATTPATPRSSGRQRKTVDRLSPVAADRAEMKAIEIPCGKGTKFADIPHISKELSKRKSDYHPFVTLHRIIFGRPGEAPKRKGHLRLFNGFAEEIVEKLEHHTADELKDICVVLNLERASEKKTLADRIAKFLLNPCDLGESKPAPKRTPQKRKATPKTRKGKAAKTGSTEAMEEVEESEDEEDASSMLEELEDEQEE